MAHSPYFFILYNYLSHNLNTSSQFSNFVIKHWHGQRIVVEIREKSIYIMEFSYHLFSRVPFHSDHS